MNRLVLIALAPMLLAAPAAAQPMDHSAMPGMQMPAKAKPPARPSAKKPVSAVPAPAAKDPHAGHAMPAAPAVGARPEPPAPGGPAMDHAGHTPTGGEPDIPKTPAPPAPIDHAADRFFDPGTMEAARAQLREEHGAAVVSKFMASIAEYQARSGPDGYRWDGEAWAGGDINRFVVKSEGEATRGEGVDVAEVQALYSRAVGPYFDLQAGVRQDFEPRSRTYLTVGTEGLAPYWFDVEAALFLSTKGEVLVRAEGSYDLRLTQRLILQPRAEFSFAAQTTAATQTGAGLSNAELGLRLRYEIRREFAPYVGVTYERRLGKTADFARAVGEDAGSASFVVGIRAWF